MLVKKPVYKLQGYIFNYMLLFLCCCACTINCEHPKNFSLINSIECRGSQEIVDKYFADQYTMAPRKASRNAFYYYMVEVKETKKISMNEASIIAGQCWEKMNAQQRAPYEQMAHGKTKFSREKYTSDGIPFSIVDMVDKKKKEKLSAMKLDIQRTLREAIELGEQDFYIIDINIFCSTSTQFVPAELAVSCFNLNNGVYRVHHTLIDPGHIPTGYRSEAIAVSGETHQLKLPPDALGEADYFKIYTDLLAFIVEDGATPPLYTLSKNIEQIEGVISQICRMFDVDPEEFRVYSLHELFFQMANLCAEQASCQKAFITDSVAEFELAKDVYDFYSELACEYHKTTDAVAHCSLSKVKRFAYLIADYCCQHLGIELIPGKHIPMKANANKRPLQPTVEDDFDSASVVSQSRTWSDATDNTSSAASSGRPYGRGKGRGYSAYQLLSQPQRYTSSGSTSSIMSPVSTSTLVGELAFEDVADDKSEISTLNDRLSEFSFSSNKETESSVLIDKESVFDYNQISESHDSELNYSSAGEGATSTYGSSQDTPKPLRRPLFRAKMSSALKSSSTVDPMPTFAAGRGKRLAAKIFNK